MIVKAVFNCILQSTAGTNVDIRSTIGTIPTIRPIEIVLRSAIYLVHAAQLRRHLGNVWLRADH